MSIILSSDVSNAKYIYESCCKLLVVEQEKLINLIKMLKQVKRQVNNKTYQSYKAQTTKLRANQERLIVEFKVRKHQAYKKWNEMLIAERLQNHSSNKQAMLEKLLVNLTYEEQTLLKDYFNK